MPLQFSSVGLDALDEVWETLYPLILKGLSHGQGDGSRGLHLLEEIRSGKSVLVVGHEEGEIQVGIVLSVLDGEAGRKLFIDMLVGNDMDQWVGDLESLIKRYRDEVGAKCIEASVRPGLAKRLFGRGWKRKAIIVEAPA